MRQREQILPGIRGVSMIRCSSLPPRVDLNKIMGLVVGIMADIEELPLCDEGECSCETTREGGSVSESATLSFRSTEMLNSSEDWAFIVEDVNGKTWLIGAKEAPYPQVTVSRSLGTAGGEAAGFTYDITHTALRTLIECVVLKER